MTEVIEFMTLGVCGLGAVVVTVMALFSSPTVISTSLARERMAAQAAAEKGEGVI